ncbi:MAG: hypothetical protein QW197_03570 [Candidatus Aenigmatarchaeota archaeon]
MARYPLEITERTPGVTVKQNTANIETPIIEFEVPALSTVYISAGSPVYLVAKDSTGAVITDGIVTFYAVDPFGIKEIKIAEARIDQLGELVDINKQYRLRASIILREKRKLVIKLISSKVAASVTFRIQAELETY